MSSKVGRAGDPLGHRVSGAAQQLARDGSDLAEPRAARQAGG